MNIFGFKEVGEANLERFTRFILIPAVRDASEDAIEKKGSPLKEIMDFVVRSILSQKQEIVELQFKDEQTPSLDTHVYHSVFDEGNGNPSLQESVLLFL